MVCLRSAHGRRCRFRVPYPYLCYTFQCTVRGLGRPRCKFHPASLVALVLADNNSIQTFTSGSTRPQGPLVSVRARVALQGELRRIYRGTTKACAAVQALPGVSRSRNASSRGGDVNRIATPRPQGSPAHTGMALEMITAEHILDFRRGFEEDEGHPLLKPSALDTRTRTTVACPADPT
nr:hypothetical protein CFP56_00653 [Quercus suber]